MKKAIPAVISFLVTYIISNELVSAFVVGTSTGDVLIRTLAPIGLGSLAALIVIFMGE